MEEKKTTEENNIYTHIDYKNIIRLKAHINPHARIMNRRRTHLSAKGQRDLARAIKRARFMALIPYVSH